LRKIHFKATERHLPYDIYGITTNTCESASLQPQPEMPVLDLPT